ncbi:MAG: DUF4870 domain-containing protein [Acidimicrobiia bacterium]
MMSDQATPDQQNWRVIAHASAFVQLVGIPSVVGPLIVWLARRDDPVVGPHARAALNFQISLLIYFLVGMVLAVVAALTIVGLVVTVLVLVGLFLLVILEMVFALLATIEASKGHLYHYPLNLNLIKA